MREAPKNSVLQSGTTGMRERQQKTTLPPRRRGQGDAAPTIPKSYTLPFSAIVELRQAVGKYGSQGRALQVATEIATRMRKPPTADEPKPEEMVRMTYKLLPRTIELIEEMAKTEYGTAGRAIAACVKTLKIKKI